jgi:hypothetical protein
VVVGAADGEAVPVEDEALGRGDTTPLSTCRGADERWIGSEPVTSAPGCAVGSTPAPARPTTTHTSDATSATTVHQTATPAATDLGRLMSRS